MRSEDPLAVNLIKNRWKLILELVSDRPSTKVFEGRADL